MIGNAHLDPVWLWGWQAGADEVVATFRSAADRCDEYPEFRFTGGEAWRYAVTERAEPELFDRIRRLVAAGRWSIPGGQWVQPDCNAPTGTAFRRQFQRGQSYFESRFGHRSTVGFNPDSFGHPATLPDLLCEAGMTAYAFHRPSKEQLPLPAQLFRWRGSAGGEVLGFRIVPAYVTRASELAGQVEIALENVAEGSEHTMAFYGVGNHGGGPTRAQIDWIIDHRNAYGGAELRFSTMEEFFAAVEPIRDSFPLVETELQHVFPGCYSAMHHVKQRQRRTESLLEQAEHVLDALGDQDAMSLHVQAAWDDVLFTSFHDILAGTSVASVWESVTAQQGRARIVAEEAIFAATRREARTLRSSPHTQLVAFNADRSAWRGLIEIEPWIDFDEWGSRWLSTPGGERVPHQLVDAESDALMTRLVAPATIDASGWTTLLVRSDIVEGVAAPVPHAAAASAEWLSGGDIEIALGADGIGRVERDGAVVLEGISLQLREDLSDTWTMESDSFDGPVVDRLSTPEWSTEELGPLRARSRARVRLGESPLELAVSVDHEGRVTLDLLVAFVERFRALQLTFLLPFEPAEHEAGVPAGAARRAAGKTEWPVQGWSRVGEAAVVTGDAYSVSVDGNRWQWTLLRSPRMAWPPIPSVRRAAARHTDQGEHEFSFQLHFGQASAAELEAAARQQLQPPVVFSRYDAVDRPPWGAAPPERLWTEAERRNSRGRRL
jgi:alpha-mannosidase